MNGKNNHNKDMCMHALMQNGLGEGVSVSWSG